MILLAKIPDVNVYEAGFTFIVVSTSRVQLKRSYRLTRQCFVSLHVVF